MSVTIKDVAKKAGVGITTVSRAMNDKSEILEETKKNILKIADELGYRPNSLAKSLVTRKSKTIGVLIPDSMYSFFSDMVQGIADENLLRGYSIVLSHSQGDADRELEYIRILEERRVDGMLIYPVQEDDRYIGELKKSSIPFVFLNRHTNELECDFVINDNFHGAYLAVDYLIKKGHSEITYLCAKQASSTGRERIEGCQEAFKRNDLNLTSLNIKNCKPNIESCYNHVKNHLIENKKITAIFVWDDKLAIGAYKAVFEAGLRIPEDIAIIGYNDIETSKYLSPPLTTIRQATHQIGETAAKILLDKLESDHFDDIKREIFKPELVIRESS